MNNNNFDPMTGQPINQQPQQQPVQNTTNIYSQQPVQPQQAVNYQQETITNPNNSYQNININKKNNSNKSIKNILLIIVGILIILGLCLLVYYKLFRNNKETVDLNTIFDPNKPIVVMNNGKYGYITSEGKTMIEPQYKKANDFYENYAIVSIDNPDTTAYNDTLYQIIDKKGNVKLSSNYSPKYYSNYDLWVVDGTLYDSNLNKMLSEGITVDYIDNGYFEYSDYAKEEAGIINYKGKKIFTIPGTSIVADISENQYNDDDLYARVKTYSEPENEVVISLKTGDILFTSEDAESYYIIEEKNGLFYYYNNTLDDGYKNKQYLFFINNKLAYQTTEVVDEVEVYDYENQILEIDYGYDYKELGKSQRLYYYDVKNKKLLDTKPSKSNSLDNLEIDLIEQTYGFKEYSSSGKYGIMSGDKAIVPCEYDDIEYLEVNLFNYMKTKGKELVLLEKDKKLLLYNIKNSKVITTFNSKYVYDYDDSTFIKINIYAEDGYTTKGYTIYNLLSDKSMDFESSSDISIGSNYITVKKDNKKIYYNTDFKQIYVEEN